MGASHSLLSPTIIAKEALRLLKNNMVMGNLVYRGYESEFPGSPKNAGSLRVRKPVRFKVTKARARTTSQITESYITVTVATQAHVSWGFYMADLSLTIEEYSDRYIRPAAAVLANQVDADLTALYIDIPNKVHESTGWVDPATFMVLGKAMQKLDEAGAPPDERVVVLNPAGHWSMANALSNWNFAEVGKTPTQKGKLGQIANCTVYMDQNIKAHTVGLWATAPAGVGTTGICTTARLAIHTTADTAAGAGLPTGIVPGASQNQKVLITGIDNDSVIGFLAGDTFTIAGVYAVNPMSGDALSTLRRFVVTADCSICTNAVSGNALVYVYPDIIHTGAYKTCDTVPAPAALVTVDEMPATKLAQNLAFHKDAFALVMVPLEKPDSTFSAVESEDGISIRVVKAYNIDTDTESIRLDILYGVKTIYPELACRIAGAATNSGWNGLRDR
jgi:hypothetical protein